MSRSMSWSARWPSAAFARAPSRSAVSAACGGEPRRMRCRAGSSRRSGDRHLQQASARARPCAGARLAAHAGLCLSPRRRAVRRRQRRCRAQGGARRSGGADGQPQCRLRHARAGRRAACAARGRRATPISRARITRSPRRSRKTAPIGASRSSRWRGCTGLSFLPIAPEHYDFLLVEARRDRPAVQAFLAALRDETTRARIRALGMEPAGE